MTQDWEYKKVSEIYEFTQKPRGLSYTNYNEIPFIPMELISNETPIIDEYILKSGGCITSGTYIENGNLLVSKITPCFENGKQGIVENLPLNFGVATTEVIPLKEIEGTSNKYFLYYYLLKKDVRASLASKMVGTTGRQRLNKDTIAHTEIPFLDLVEQESIVQALRTVQIAKETRQKELILERERKAALMDHLFTHGTRNEPRKQTEIGEIPESWEVKQIKDLADVKGGKRLSKGSDFAKEATEYPYIRVTDFREGSVRLSELKYLEYEIQQQIKNYCISSNDVYISIAGTIGLVGTIPKEVDGANLTENAAKLVIKDNSILDKDYLAIVLSNEFSQKQFEVLTVKTSQPKLALARIQQVKIPVPCLSEQKEIANTIRTNERKMLSLQNEIDLLDELFQALLEELMTGRLSVAPLLEPIKELVAV